MRRAPSHPVPSFFLSPRLPLAPHPCGIRRLPASPAPLPARSAGVHNALHEPVSTRLAPALLREGLTGPPALSRALPVDPARCPILLSIAASEIQIPSEVPASRHRMLGGRPAAYRPDPFPFASSQQPQQITAARLFHPASPTHSTRRWPRTLSHRGKPRRPSPPHSPPLQSRMHAAVAGPGRRRLPSILRFIAPLTHPSTA